MVLAAVFILIAVRQVGRFTFRIWQVMLAGAIAVLLTGQIAPADALAAINPGVMVFLFCMFIVGEALVSGGYLDCIARRIFHRAKNPSRIVLVLLFSMGMLSALLMNDTLAIIGTPLVLSLAARHQISPKMLLLALAFAVTTGSVMSPIGNPQNLLVATTSGMASPFVTFAAGLILPTILSLLAAFVVLRLFFPTEFADRPLDHGVPVSCNARSMRVCQCSLFIIIALILANAAFTLAGSGTFMSLPLIAVCGAVPVILFSENRMAIVREIDWSTLIFFASMFVLMESVWQTGFFQSFMSPGTAASVPFILAASIGISQFISNVPFVALFQPLIVGAGGTTTQLLALAAGSTIAGNLTILGAASNVIIVQNAENHGATITFLEFAKVGVPLTIIQAVIYGIFLGFA